MNSTGSIRWLCAALIVSCSGSMPPPDGGLPDAGPFDGGGDGGSDGGVPDAGPLDCDLRAHDPILGTAQVGAGYRLVDSAVLPGTAWVPVAVKDEALPDGGRGLVVFGYSGAGTVHRLGVWPALFEPSAANGVFDAVAAEDRARQVIITPSLVNAQDKLLAAYRTISGGGFVDGGISVFDTNAPDAGTRWLPAPGNESLLALGSYFLVGGDGLGAAGGPRGVYGVKHDVVDLRAGLVATYPAIAGENVRPGLMALTAHGLPVLGYYLDGADRHVLRLPAPSQVMEALSGAGSAIALGDAPELQLGDDVEALAGFSTGVVALHTQQVRGVLPALGALQWHGLTRQPDGGTRVDAPVDVLRAADDGCTAVSQVMAAQTVLIVGVWDKNGQRLLRLVPR